MEARDPEASVSVCNSSLLSVSLVPPTVPFPGFSAQETQTQAPFGTLLHGQHGAHWEVPPALASGIFHKREEVGRREAERGQLERKERGGTGEGFWWR